MKIPTAFDRCCIPAPTQRWKRAAGTPGLAALLVAQICPIMPNILTPRALPSRRIAGLGARQDFHHGLLNPNPSQRKIPPEFELPALLVMAVGSFEPTFTQVSRDAAWCACLCSEEA